MSGRATQPGTGITKGTKPMRIVILGAFAALYFLLMASTFNSLGQVLPMIVADLHFTWAQAGMGFTVLGIACGAASMLPAAVIRRHGVAVTLLIGMVQLIAGFAALAWMQGVWMYLLATLLLGLGFCFCGSIAAVDAIGNAFDRKRSTAIGLYFTAGNLGAVAGPITFFAIHSATGSWRLYWLACAAGALVLGLFAAAVCGRYERRVGVVHGPADEAPPPPEGWTARAALASWQFWIVVLAYTACLLINTTVHSFAYQHMLEHRVAPAVATGFISAAAFVAAVAAALAGFAGQRVDARALTVVALVGSAFSSLALILPLGTAALGFFAVTFGIGIGVSTVGTALLLRGWFGGRAALELYSVMTVVSTSAAIGPSIGGHLHDTMGSFVPNFAGQALIGLVVALVVGLARRPVPRTAAGDAVLA
ncbi:MULTISPECIES: CynX/NimT family MFS transporter [unclassified Novosphingobium]|uniref:MFS transporter n=1 Tax=unclassified Novosphingobium TaxID=2644732 RepID=UPI000D31078B|nr:MULTISPECIES: MFS transporter [unclassified Novosphingobium]PTR12087.1 cyanate permease [Novosphingobium sp. GV055]PUB05488.1 cyanate permease [Novosphingobium sp. GV061]PUB21721.1 cyanate permease [Novosphingobium sp. GV079]PUB43494.1 cyanate permease [Novosphingobium sp. GV027]